MELELGTAVIAGIVGTGVMTFVMAMGSMMGMGMDIPKMLGTMFFPAGAAARISGLILHFMMGPFSSSSTPHFSTRWESRMRSSAGARCSASSTASWPALLWGWSAPYTREWGAPLAR